MTTLFQPRPGIKKRLALLAALAACLLLVLWRPVRQLLWQVALAALLAALCLPLTRWLERRMKPPLAAILGVGAVAFGLVGGFVLALPQLAKHVSALISQLPGLIASLQTTWQGISRMEWFSALGLDTNLPSRWLREAGTFVAAEAPRMLSTLAGAVNSLGRAFLAPVLAYYFLRDRETFAYKISLWIPARQRKTVLTALRQMKRETVGYLRGQGLISICVMALTSLGLMVLGVPSFLTLGILMGLCEFIPYVGPLIGGVPILLFSLPLGMPRILWVMGMVIAVQQIESYLLSPRLMAGAISLHPVYVLLLLSAGGLIGGLGGMMAAIPLFVCARGAMHVLYVEKQPEKVVKFLRFPRE